MLEEKDNFCYNARSTPHPVREEKHMSAMPVTPIAENTNGIIKVNEKAANVDNLCELAGKRFPNVSIYRIAIDPNIYRGERGFGEDEYFFLMSVWMPRGLESVTTQDGGRHSCEVAPMLSLGQVAEQARSLRVYDLRRARLGRIEGKIGLCLD